MKIKLDEARELAHKALQALGYGVSEATKISGHLIDSELRGYGVAGLARILSIADRLAGNPPQQTTKTTRDAPATAQIDGQDSVGYLVAHEATRVAIKKAKVTGIAAVGANGTWYTGMLSYYAEMAAAEDMVAVIHSNCTAWVAPEGGYRPMFGTNPYCVGFPSSGVPIIYDIGTSKIIHADIMLARRLGRDLPPGSAFDAEGNLTVNPHEALQGAMAVWGGHRGSGLAVVVQLMGVMAGSPALPPNLEDFGFMIIVVNPAMFRPLEDFKTEIDDFSDKMRASPPIPGGTQLRMPFERSNAVREKNLSVGEIEVEGEILSTLREMVQQSRD